MKYLTAARSWMDGLLVQQVRQVVWAPDSIKPVQSSVPDVNGAYCIYSKKPNYIPHRECTQMLRNKLLSTPVTWEAAAGTAAGVSTAGVSNWKKRQTASVLHKRAGQGIKHSSVVCRDAGSKKSNVQKLFLVSLCTCSHEGSASCTCHICR